MFTNYLKFLDYLMGNLNKYFTLQAPYIKCAKGCAKCCSNGDYPFSEMEIKLLQIGFDKLDEDTKNIILKKIDSIKKEKANFKGEGSFTYACPFLINNICSVYDYRGIICRTFGLIYIKEGSDKMQIPFCAYDGLNYSNVLDKERGILSEEKMKALGLTEEPKAYNIHYNFVTSKRVGEAFNFDYGRRGSLIDLLSDNPKFSLKDK
ncbi:YkgJ family cysteine cluster protein [bacterium]|nr:YkgJ family cysteine cluster protein [bacterium]